MNSPGTTRVVEQMLDHASNGRWDPLQEFEIVEPESVV